MIKKDLNGGWQLLREDISQPLECSVPCSVYRSLYENGLIPDPYYRENEYSSTGISDLDSDFSKSFDVDAELLTSDMIYLRFECIDTLGEVSLNGRLLAQTDNMHRIWEFDVRDILREKDNLLTVKIKSPTKYCDEMQKKRPIWGQDMTYAGYPYLRKAHCMFGWDWGPILPDMGLLRDVSLNFYSGGRIKDVYYTQRHEKNCVKLKALIHTENIRCENALLTVTAPGGEIVCSRSVDLRDGSDIHETEVTVEAPQLWWVNGFGEQPLYTCTVSLVCGGEAADVNSVRIGLRTLTVSREKDQWGEEFCFINNGVKIFAMGGNYIPEDQIVSRCSKERTLRLLDDCKAANFNFIRVWGGGYYPDGYFYDWCDENGIIVWQDFMFACSAYLLTDSFRSTVEAEVIDNVIRLRNHPSLGLWCGNNEVESAWEYWGLPDDPEAKRDYLILFEDIIPRLLKKYDPDTFYWPSSPSSGGGFKDASSNHAGDMHYWDVWHNFKPIEEFRKYHYRFCSEYGFESLPDIKTCRYFADGDKGDLDLCSNVMQAHQKCTQGNEKIMYYLAQMVNYPYSFERLVYCSQLVQADCIRSNVEHMRRARGRCMGSAYWQINDSNPVISWSSVDYFGRWKGLHYAARKFYAPILLSCDDTDPQRPVLNVSNETPEDINVLIRCRLRNSRAEILAECVCEGSVPACTAKDMLVMELDGLLDGREDRRTRYLEYSLEKDGATVSGGTTLFVRPKEFRFEKPGICCTVSETEDGFVLELTAENYAKSVCLSLKDSDCVFSDNWFDIHGGEPVRVTVSEIRSGKLSPDDLRNQLDIISY